MTIIAVDDNAADLQLISQIIETNYQFSDWDRATIIWNSPIPMMEKHSEIQIIADKTSDAELCGQISERIAFDKEVLRLFADNPYFAF